VSSSEDTVPELSTASTVNLECFAATSENTSPELQDSLGAVEPSKHSAMQQSPSEKDECVDKDSVLLNSFIRLGFTRNFQGPSSADHFLGNIRELSEIPKNTVQTKHEKPGDHPEGRDSEDDREDNTASNESCGMESACSSDQGFDRLARALTQSRTDATIRYVMSKFDRVFEVLLQDFVHRCGNLSESSSQNSGFIGTDGPRHNEKSGGGVLKRRRGTEEDEDGAKDNDDGLKPNRGSGTPHAATGGRPHMRLACPFRKHDLSVYNIHTHRTCVEGHWPTTHRIKYAHPRLHQPSRREDRREAENTSTDAISSTSASVANRPSRARPCSKSMGCCRQQRCVRLRQAMRPKGSPRKSRAV